MKIFCFATGVSASDRLKMKAAISDLGGARLLSEEDDSMDGCRPLTHLVVNLPTRSEKFLTGASAKDLHNNRLDRIADRMKNYGNYRA